MATSSDTAGSGTARTSRRPAWLAPSLQGYRRSWIRGDVIAGLAAGTVVIPQAMAYSTIAGLPVQIGLYTCMVPAILYALLGGARTISVSTTSTIAVLVSTTLAELPNAGQLSDHDLLRAAFTLTLMVGGCLLIMRLLRLGSLVEIISPATMTGIRIGVGLTVAASQLPALLGMSDVSEAGFFVTIGNVLGHLEDLDVITTVVSVVALAVLLGLRRLAPRIPGPLVVVVAGIALVIMTPLETTAGGAGLSLIDKVPTGLPVPTAPVPADIVSLLPGAFAIAVMAFLETVVVARTNRRRDEPTISVDQELLATGVAALGGGLTQTLPPAGGFSQSAVNLRAGARTQLAALVTAALAILVALLLAPLLDNLPRAILAAMVMVAILGLLKPADFLLYARIDRAELWVAVVVAVIGLVGGMLIGVAVGVVLTLALVVRNVNRARARPLYRSSEGWTTNPPSAGSGTDDDSFPPPGVVLLHLDGSLYAGNANATADAVLSAAHPEGTYGVVLEGTAVRDVTVPLVQTLHDLADKLIKDDVRLVLAAFPTATAQRMARSDWFVDYQRAGWVTATVDKALQRLRTAGPSTGDSIADVDD
ncbi:SulP family inorganic anion transporter [Microlunatus soli]|uniref:High affinity sulphate transporter 1 n=1 Tax=Microlunatus soli TaxID=630515 RepID=A0A1H1YXN8_9ACTN|nr:SulP family inorganic anion transporter [Microlunatus soli]SDT26099.1 high affinity sulphate transporter 1 [Microlunatus soli]